MTRFARIAAAIFTAVLLLALPASPALAQARPDEGGFTITDYGVNVVVSGDNTYAVTEMISVDFSEPRHGIYRDIPLNGQWLRDSDHGGNTEYHAGISGIAVEGAPYDVSQDGIYTRIKVGDADRSVEGEQVYRISYNLQFPDDGMPDFDEVYYNLVGNEWATTIRHVSFSVTLPAAFDRAAVGFSMGHIGDSGNAASDLEYAVDGNTIHGETLRALEAYEGLTLRVELPQGYFAPADAAQSEVAPPDEPIQYKEQPGALENDRPSGGFGSIGVFGLLLGGGGVAAILAIIAVVVLIVVLAVRQNGGIGGATGPRSDLAQDELLRMNQINQLNHMQQMNQMDQMNQMNQPDTTSVDVSSFTGSDSGSTGCGGSW